MDEKKRHEEGMKMRRAVLGDAYVDKARAAQNEFNAEFQDLITRYAWGEIWTRPELDRKTRSLVAIGMMVAMNRSEELQLHLKAALKNGVTRAQIKEVLLQSAIYCGVPAANHAFQLAERVFASASAQISNSSG
jgi:4-carboxymuconolactone decarboxylase